ncbi:uncharacterized protein LOC130811017 [Amaranthus tricolor]|uniref:uncharacterized protein LOC130811017 n=1 Tax=Amaranthus tricolor TaxID=29722 RepID=UPI00258DCBE5|nr:uncharacterized protein LOC130811017 [Amaranthus tricolor]
MVTRCYVRAFKGFIFSLFGVICRSVSLSNQVVNVTSNPSPTPIFILTQETQNLFIPSPSSTPSESPQTQILNDATVNLGETFELVPWDDGNELVDDPSEDDVDVDEDALANDMTLDGKFEKDMIFDSKKALLEAVRVYHIRRNVEYRTETSNQTSSSLKCKRGCSWKLRARLNPYSTSWFISKYNGKHGNFVLDSNTVSAGHIHLTSSVFNNVIRNCVSKDPSIKVSVVRQIVKDRFGIEVTYKLAWCAKQQALLSIYGTREDSYSLLPRFLKALQQSNPGTVVEWFFKEDNDTGVYDGDKGIFPLAFSLVEKECIAAWSWFIVCICKHLTQKMGLCIVSDRHVGILVTMEET